MYLSADIIGILETLNSNNFKAYVVGGCVRNSLMGMEAKDFDITTNATPNEIINCFPNDKLLKTGLQHGTVTLIKNKIPYEITTFRTDGKYSDSRHPDSVTFVKTLEDDLARRDFTMNALAYNPTEGVIDIFNGRKDIENKIIRCVGKPEKRIKEDALRILRALRFSSTYGMSIEKETSKAIIEYAPLLNKGVAHERIFTELNKILCGKHILQVMLNYSEIFACIMPELRAMIGLSQNCKYHIYDVWEHTAYTMHFSKADNILRWSALLHDSGKTMCATHDEKGDHFYSHHKYSREIASDILNRFKAPNKLKEDVDILIHYHDCDLIMSGKFVRKYLNKMGEDLLFKLISLQRADGLAHAQPYAETIAMKCDKFEEFLHKELAKKPCFTLNQLAINGNDLAAIGIEKDKKMGFILNELLDKVINNYVENSYEALSNYVLSNYIKQD